MRLTGSTSEARSVLLGAVACCVRDELETALELLGDHVTPDVDWADVGVALTKDRIEALAVCVGRPVEDVAAFVAIAGEDVRARWVLQTACWELAGDSEAVAGRAELLKFSSLHNAVAGTMAIAGLVHAHAGMLSSSGAELAQEICLAEALSCIEP
jgi:hypothetical protein